MNTRAKKMLSMVISTNKNLLDLPKYETTKGTRHEEKLDALATVNKEKVASFFSKKCLEKDKESKKGTDQINKKKYVENQEIEEKKNVNEKVNTGKENEKDHEGTTENIGNYLDEELFSSETEYIPDSTDIETEDSDSEDPNKFSSYNKPVKMDKLESLPLEKKSDESNGFNKKFDTSSKFEPSTSKVEQFTNTRPWTKKNACPYCFREFTHFPRHLQRHHKNEAIVQKLLSMNLKNPERRKLLDTIRRQGNFILNSQTEIVRPVRRPKSQRNEEITSNSKNKKDQYLACQSCLGFFARNYLRRHKRICPLEKEKKGLRENHLSSAQMFAVCSGANASFYDSLRLKKEVFPIMRNDEIAKIAMKDIIICSYAESLLRKHKRRQIKNVISNKMRELGRLLINIKQIADVQCLFEVLKPEMFGTIVSATKVICGYNAETRTFTASSLALHMGTTLKQVCDIANKLIIEKNPLLPCIDQEHCLKNIKRLRKLIESHWNYELASLALKNLNEQTFIKPKFLPVTSDVMKFQTYVLNEAKEAFTKLKEKNGNKIEFRKLSECVLGLTVLLNRKRIGEIQHLTVNAYNTMTTQSQQEEFIKGLTESEQILTRNFKRVVTLGKGSKPVPILFSSHLQEFINIMLYVRHLYVSEKNEYLFANPNTENRWISGYNTLKKLAKKSGVSDDGLFTSTRLRKQISTILQVLNISENEMEQFASFMGHTKKTHENYYRLPQDIYQTAKVSKLLLAINSGKAQAYKGKSLDEIELSDGIETDSDLELTKDQHRGGEPTEKWNDCCDESKEESIIENTMEQIAGLQSQKEGKSKYYLETKKSTQDKKITRTRWLEEDKKIVRCYFQDHIKNKRAPKKHEVETFLDHHKSFLKKTNWVKLKAFVCNCYK